MSRILLVDDEPDMIWAISQGLSKAGYEIATASDGVEVLMSVGRCAPDMIVLDVSMPRLDGWQVCASLRRDPQLGAIPILLLTGHDSVEDRVRGA